MFVFVQKLKQRPEDVRNKIAILSAVFVTLLIIGVWFLFIKNKDTSKEVNQKSISEDIKPLMMIFGGVKTEFKEIKDSFKKSEN